MDPLVVAAWIAAGASAATLAGTLIEQTRSRHQQREQLDKTLKAQSEQLATQLRAQSKQLEDTLAEQRSRALNERFATAADQLGDDRPAAVRLAGVYAMAGLADDWPKNRQTCVDVLCAYLRMPYSPDPGDEAPEPDRLAFRASREVRHTVIRVITAHLQPDDRRPAGAQDWRGLDLDFTGAVLDGGSFAFAQFSGGTVSFDYAEVSSGAVSFGATQFSGGTVSFDFAKFSGGEVRFISAEFAGGEVTFYNAEFSGGTASFNSAKVVDAGTVLFDSAVFSGGTVTFQSAKVWTPTGGLGFEDAEFTGGRVSFDDARIIDGMVTFYNAEFSGGRVTFDGTEFSGGEVNFDGAEFSGGTVDFSDAEFSGGKVDFRHPHDWYVRPVFPWTGLPPPGVLLPGEEDQSQA